MTFPCLLRKVVFTSDIKAFKHGDEISVNTRETLFRVVFMLNGKLA